MHIKDLMQKRDALVKQMSEIMENEELAERDLSEEETAEFEKLEAELAGIDKKIEKLRALDAADLNTRDDDDEPDREDDEKDEDAEAAETRAFEDYLRNGDVVFTRSTTNMTKDDNGAVIPQSIANKIIEKVIDICPIYHDAERYNVKGTLSIPYYDDTTDDIKMEYADEFTDGNSHSGKFLNITLTGFLGRAICDVSKSLINNSNFDIVSFVINHMAQAIAVFLEKELLIGTPEDTTTSPTTPAKILGLSTIGSGMTVSSKTQTAVDIDNLIELQDKVIDAYQGNAYWIMNRATRSMIRKLKDGDGNYLLNRDLTARWGYTLLGKDVYTSDAMPEIKAANAGKPAIFYGDMTGLAVKVSEEINIDVLREVKARQHAVEVVGFVECDAKVQNAQKIARLIVKAS